MSQVKHLLVFIITPAIPHGAFKMKVTFCVEAVYTPVLAKHLNPNLCQCRIVGKPYGREVASLDRKRLGQDRWQGRKTGSEAFSIRRLGGRRWRGGRGPMGFEGSPGVRLRDGRAGRRIGSWVGIIRRAAN